MSYFEQQAQQNKSILRLTIKAILIPDPIQQTKVAKPDLYYKDRKKLQIFLFQLELYFFFNTQDFLNEDWKIMFAAIYLWDIAAQWFEPYLKDWMQKTSDQQQPETNAVFENFNIFVIKIKQNFGDLNKVWKATYIVMTLQQKTSVAVYITEFQQAAAYLKD